MFLSNLNLLASCIQSRLASFHGVFVLSGNTSLMRGDSARRLLRAAARYGDAAA